MKIIFYFFIVLLIYGCSFDKSSDFWEKKNIEKISKNKENINISHKNLLFNEYKKNIIKYSDQSDYPDIKKNNEKKY